MMKFEGPGPLWDPLDGGLVVFLSSLTENDDFVCVRTNHGYKQSPPQQRKKEEQCQEQNSNMCHCSCRWNKNRTQKQNNHVLWPQRWHFWHISPLTSCTEETSLEYSHFDDAITLSKRFNSRDWLFWLPDGGAVVFLSSATENGHLLCGHTQHFQNNKHIITATTKMIYHQQYKYIAEHNNKSKWYYHLTTKMTFLRPAPPASTR